MKKFFMLFLLTTVIMISAKAQDDKMSASSTGFHFLGGVNLALPFGDFSDFSSFGIGAEIMPEYNISSEASFLATTGYTYYFGKDGADGVGFIPVLVGARFYPTPSFFLGGKAGLGILTGNGDNTSAFDYQPQIGYNSTKVQVALGYNGLSKNGETLSNMSLTLMYKFK